MMNRKRWWIYVLLSVILLGGYLLVLRQISAEENNEKPEIVLDEDQLTVSTSEGQEALLAGVRAYDKEDGDLSDEVIISSISEFNSDQEREVHYVVFDRDNQVGEAVRTITYSDYVPPKITLNGPLIVDTFSTTRINKLVGAISSVDGDISNKVMTKVGTLTDGVFNLEVQVADSTGTDAQMTFQCEYNRNIYMADIKLIEYLVRLPAGTEYAFDANIAEVLLGNSNRNDLIPEVSIQNNVDYWTPGTYEVLYFLNLENGNSGYTKCTVIVE